MIRKVLIVDDDQIWLRLIKKKFEKYAKAFETITVGDGMAAVDRLKEHAISLVVTDLQMPQMDGLTLLAHLSEQYPDIPVIIMTAYSSPNSKKNVLEGGAAGYIEKPFVVEDLAEKIKSTLEKESEGGTLQTVPLDMFIQLIEMEQKTCTIRVANKATGKKGVLFFNNGNLMEARYHDLQGKPAAYKIFSWDKVTLSIQDECAIKEKRIAGELQAILFDAMRLKDEAEDGMAAEAASGPEATPAPEPMTGAAPRPAPAPVQDAPEGRKERIEARIGDAKGLVGITTEIRWNDHLGPVSRFGRFFGAGALKTAFFSRGGPTDVIVLPGDEPIEVMVESGCARDRLIEALSEWT